MVLLNNRQEDFPGAWGLHKLNSASYYHHTEETPWGSAGGLRSWEAGGDQGNTNQQEITSKPEKHGDLSPIFGDFYCLFINDMLLSAVGNSHITVHFFKHDKTTQL